MKGCQAKGWQLGITDSDNSYEGLTGKRVNNQKSWQIEGMDSYVWVVVKQKVDNQELLVTHMEGWQAEGLLTREVDKQKKGICMYEGLSSKRLTTKSY